MNPRDTRLTIVISIFATLMLVSCQPATSPRQSAEVVQSSELTQTRTKTDGPSQPVPRDSETGSSKKLRLLESLQSSVEITGRVEKASELKTVNGSEDIQGGPIGEGPGIQVNGWMGYVVSNPNGSQFDDSVVFLPEGQIGCYGLEGAIPAIQEEIVALRDKEQPGKNAHFWGFLRCPAIDYGGCQLVVEQIQVSGPGEFPEPQSVVAWEGTIVSLATDGPGAPQPDDAFLLSGEYPVRYGIDSAVAEGSGELELADTIAWLRDNGQTVKLWGLLTCGVPDAGGCHIAVSRIEAGDIASEITPAS